MKQSNEHIIAISADPNDPEDGDVTEAAVLVALAERQRRLSDADWDDNPEWTEEDFARARPASEVSPPHILAQLIRQKPGRPAGSAKERISIRLDSEALARFRSDGPGWQTRINAAVRKAAGLP